MEFAVVKFTKENDAIGVIPLTWVKKTSESIMSYYPPPQIKDIERYVNKKVTPTIDWDLVEIDIIHEYQTYDDARKKLPKAADTSNLSSDEEEKQRKRKRKPKNMSFPGEDKECTDEESDSDIVPAKKQTSLPAYPPMTSFTSQIPSDFSINIQEPFPIFTATEVLNDINYTPTVKARCPLTPLARPLFNSSPTPANDPNFMTPKHPSTQTTEPTFVTPIHPSTSTSEPTFMTPNHSSASNNLPETEHLRSNPTQQHTPHHSSLQLLLPSKSGCNNENCNRIFVVVGQLQSTVADLTDVVKRLNEKMDKHFTNNTQEREDEKSYEVLGKIPVQSLEEMEELEKTLENPQFKKQLFKVLTSVGGKDIKTMVYNCLRRLMSYNVGVEYSYSGNTARNKEKTKKKAFAKTNACKITNHK